MFISIRIWWVRHKARILSKHTDQTVVATIGTARVGRFARGKEVKGW